MKELSVNSTSRECRFFFVASLCEITCDAQTIAHASSSVMRQFFTTSTIYVTGLGTDTISLAFSLKRKLSFRFIGRDNFEAKRRPY